MPTSNERKMLSSNEALKGLIGFMVKTEVNVYHCMFLRDRLADTGLQLGARLVWLNDGRPLYI